MLELLLLCATYVWLATEGPVDHYEIFLDDQPFATLMPITEPLVEVCVDDALPHTITVRAFDFAGNSSEVADPSLPRVIQADLPRAPLPVEVRADLDLDGTVGGGDFGIFAQVFGCVNDGQQVISCP